MTELAQLAHVAHALLHTPFIQGGLAGAGVAAYVDVEAFCSWKSWDDSHRYDWRIASFRWVKGFIIGALGAVGVKAAV